MDLKGIRSDSEHNFAVLNVRACDPAYPPEGSTCATEAEIDAYMETKMLLLWVKTNYIAFDDIDKPLHSHFFQASRT